MEAMMVEVEMSLTSDFVLFSSVKQYHLVQ